MIFVNLFFSRSYDFLKKQIINNNSSFFKKINLSKITCLQYVY